jgi:hypothetical protein
MINSTNCTLRIYFLLWFLRVQVIYIAGESNCNLKLCQVEVAGLAEICRNPICGAKPLVVLPTMTAGCRSGLISAFGGDEKPDISDCIKIFLRFPPAQTDLI